VTRPERKIAATIAMRMDTARDFLFLDSVWEFGQFCSVFFFIRLVPKYSTLTL